MKKDRHSALFLVRHLPEHPGESYLIGLHASIGVGASKTSNSPALANLISDVGESLDPKIVLPCSVLNGIFRHPAFLVTPPLLVFRLAF